MSRRELLKNEAVIKLINDLDDYEKLRRVCKTKVLEAKTSDEVLAWDIASELGQTALALIEVIKILCTELDSRSENLLNK